MTEIKRMSNIKFTASATIDSIKWAMASERKKALLRESDWTQLRDVQLLFTSAQRLAWDGWRRRVRSIKSKDYQSPELFIQALESLASKLPSISSDLDSPDRPVIVDGETVPLIEDTSISLDDAIWEMGRLALQVAMKRSGIIDSYTFGEQVSEAIEALTDDVLEDGKIDHQSYPLLYVMSQHTTSSIRDVATDIMNRRHTWLAHTTSIQCLIDKAATDALTRGSDLTSDARRDILVTLDKEIQELLTIQEGP